MNATQQAEALAVCIFNAVKDGGTIGATRGAILAASVRCGATKAIVEYVLAECIAADIYVAGKHGRVALKNARIEAVPMFDAMDAQIAEARTAAKRGASLAEKLAALRAVSGLESLRSRLRLRTFDLQDAGLI